MFAGGGSDGGLGPALALALAGGGSDGGIGPALAFALTVLTGCSAGAHEGRAEPAP